MLLHGKVQFTEEAPNRRPIVRTQTCFSHLPWGRVGRCWGGGGGVETQQWRPPGAAPKATRHHLSADVHPSVPRNGTRTPALQRILGLAVAEGVGVCVRPEIRWLPMGPGPARTTRARPETRGDELPLKPPHNRAPLYRPNESRPCQVGAHGEGGGACATRVWCATPAASTPGTS